MLDGAGDDTEDGTPGHLQIVQFHLKLFKIGATFKFLLVARQAIDRCASDAANNERVWDVSMQVVHHSAINIAQEAD